MLIHMVVIALFTLGYCCTFWEGMIFAALGDYMECNMPDWIWKPLGGCYICACMWIGSGVYWLLYADSLQDWFITCVGAMGINAVISFISKIADKEPPKADPEINIKYTYEE